jgi:hypothetical protein
MDWALIKKLLDPAIIHLKNTQGFDIGVPPFLYIVVEFDN